MNEWMDGWMNECGIFSRLITSPVELEMETWTIFSLPEIRDKMAVTYANFVINGVQIFYGIVYRNLKTFENITLRRYGSPTSTHI